MDVVSTALESGSEWLDRNASGEPQEIVKTTTVTRAWFAVIDGRVVFVKWYPADLRDSWVKIEAAIAGGRLHRAIVPLKQRIDVRDGTLLIYDRVAGESLDPMAARTRFAALPQGQRIAAVLTVVDALAAVAESGYMVVDWYEGNMIYDFDDGRLWLFDWDLSREGGAFRLEMEANYGSSRLMAPEEFVRGSWLDERTLVFNAGRYALLNLPDLAALLAPVLARATYPAPFGRYPKLSDLGKALQEKLLTLIPPDAEA